MFKSREKKIERKINEVVAILRDELNVSEAEARAAFEGTQQYLLLTMPECEDYKRPASWIACSVLRDMERAEVLKTLSPEEIEKLIELAKKHKGVIL